MNKAENIVEYGDLGKIRYVRNRRARNLAIRIKPDGEVRVTIPGYISQKKAEHFVFSKKRWILQKIHQRKMHEDSGLVIKNGDDIYVRGKRIRICLKNEQDTLEESLWRILHREAAAYLPGRVQDLAREHGLHYSGVKVRRMKTRWGSCTARDGINLNTWLMMIPEHLSDYVILHELAHTRHRDHSPAFWSYLDRLTEGRSKALRKELRSQQIMLINPE